MSRKPYNPATAGPQVHDRRARELNRGSKGHVVETEVDDPYEAGGKIATLRSVRDDPLADHFARGHIDSAQFAAGREFQRCFEIAERGPQAMQMTEAVDGTPLRETLTDAQLMAFKQLSKCRWVLGSDGMGLMSNMLVSGMSGKQIAASRGMTGQAWERYFGKRMSDCLNLLAMVFGFSNSTNC